MIEAFIAVVVLALVQEWRHSRAQDRFGAERDKHATQVESILSGHRQEIAALCQRIQAPEYAVVQHQQETMPPSPPAANPMLDEDYWKAIEQIDQLEREGFDVTALRT